LTRELVNRLPQQVDKRGPDISGDVAPDYHETAADEILSKMQSSEPLWVFAIGSLIWNPTFDAAETRPALVSGWQRAFCYGPDTRRRGNPDAPGLMLSLDQGGECWGIALRMSDENLRANLIDLLDREPPCPVEWVTAETSQGPVRAIAFTASRVFWAYQPEPPEDQVADALASAVGHLGSMADYLLNTVTQLENAGIHDPYLWRMQDLVAQRLERLD
jgi:cation transport protein ChaC